MIKNYGVYGTLEGHAPGLFIMRTPNKETARFNLSLVEKSAYNPLNIQAVEGAWSTVLEDTLDHIRKQEDEYYTYLGNYVYYVEI